MAFQSYQGSIFTREHHLGLLQPQTFNPIKVRFLQSKDRSILLGSSTFNPIKVRFLRIEDFFRISTENLSILSRFDFYLPKVASGDVIQWLSILSRFDFYVFFCRLPYHSCSFQSYQGSIFTKVDQLDGFHTSALSILSRFDFY